MKKKALRKKRRQLSWDEATSIHLAQSIVAHLRVANQTSGGSEGTVELREASREANWLNQLLAWRSNPGSYAEVRMLEMKAQRKRHASKNQ